LEIFHDWLNEDGSDGEFRLLYRGSRDGLSGSAFHSNCDNKGFTLTIIETTDGKVIGGYSNTPWSSSGNGNYSGANKAFLFELSGSGISEDDDDEDDDYASPCKMKLEECLSDQCAIFNHSSFGPTFDGDNEMIVQGSNVRLNQGITYHPGSLPPGSYTIKEMEVFQVMSTPPARITTSKGKTSQDTILGKPVIRFSNDTNKAINTKHACLLHAESEMML
jgi:hypothetical protein